jgi:hypothetical protein
MKTRRLLLADDRLLGASVAGRSRIGRAGGYGGDHRREGPHQDGCSPELRRLWKGRDVPVASRTRSISVFETIIPREGCSSAIARADHTH